MEKIRFAKFLYPGIIIPGLILFFITISLKSKAGTVTISSSTIWSSINGGTGGGVPTSADNVVINAGCTLTVNTTTAVCAGITINNNGGSSTTATLLFNSGKHGCCICRKTIIDLHWQI